MDVEALGVLHAHGLGRDDDRPHRGAAGQHICCAASLALDGDGRWGIGPGRMATTLWSLATGASLTALTVIDTVAMFE